EKKRKEDEKLAAAEAKRLEADAKKLEEEQKKEAARLAAEAAKNPQGSQPSEPGRRVIRPGETPPPSQQPVAATTPPPSNTTPPPSGTTPPPSSGTTAATQPKTVAPGAYLGGKAGGGAMIPAATAEDAKADPRFSASALVEDARVKVVAVTDKYPYFGIANNGCGQGKHFVMAELLSPFDGMPQGIPVVLRIEDVTLGPARMGSNLAFSGLRRAGKGQDGTFVYCGRGTAFPVRR
ncbi:MAG: hypothetical protein SFW67_37620, partial [Myxococcaceae bacterium]|nr:hypothetical protein [Myxococcaceae bacterium]